MKTPAPLILASGSPRRKQLLEALGLEFEVVVREVEEIVQANINPRAVAVMIAENKAKAYGDLAGENLVLTADTLVAVDGDILGKPADEDEAFAMLTRLSGRSHEVVSGVSFFHKGRFQSFSEETKVTFRELNDAEIRYYIEKYKPLDKAGAYGIQEWIGMIGISGIQGDFYNVMGLPIGRIYRELIQLE